jgi:putative ABC transport system permease protein
MHFLRLLRHRLRALFRKNAVDRELEREMAMHLDQLAREHVAAGLSEPAARRAARHDFGSSIAALEESRDARRVTLVHDVVADSRYALRLLARSPGFAVTAILSLALGIGANAAIFSLADTVLLRSLPVERPHELVFLQIRGSERANGAPPYPCFDRIRAESPAFSGLVAFATDQLRLEVDGRIEQVFGQVASGSYFEMLGVRPAAGRLMTMADEPLAPPVAVIGYSYWQQRFGGSADAIGRTIVYKNRPYTIVGVTAAGFRGLDPGRQVDVTLPITSEGSLLTNTETWWFTIVGRLRPGATIAQATAQADTVFQSFMSDRVMDSEMRKKHFDRAELVEASHGSGGVRSRFSRPLLVLTLVAGVVLLIACVNLGNLLLARGSAREHEFAVRLATGAGSGRLIRQLLTETLWLFGLGSAAGLAMAYFASHALAGFVAIGRNPILLDVQFDGRLVAFAGTIALAAGLVTGVWPAFRAIRTDPAGVIKDGQTRVAGARRLRTTGRWLVPSQVALSLVLLVVAALFARTMINLRQVDLGFSGTRILTMSLDPSFSGSSAASVQSFWAAVLARTRGVPGVRDASLSVLTPLSGRDTGKRVTMSGYTPSRETDRAIHLNHVSEDYFRAFGIAVRAGRVFTANDVAGAVKVAVINETAAAAYFAGRNPLGQTIDFGRSNVYEIVGVVQDARHLNVRAAAPRFVFVPLWQPVDPIGRITLAVASDLPQPALLRAVSDEVRRVQPRTLISDVIGVEEQIDATLVSERLLATLATAFAALALGLAAIGLYGTLSYSVARRRSEFGIRMALGAERARVAGTVVRDVLLHVAAGLAIGLPAAVATARIARDLLFGVVPGDVASYLLSMTVLVLVAGLAAWLPARRACRVDPAETLRQG